MPRAIIIELLPHTTEAEAIELADEIQAVMQLHYAPRYVSDVDFETDAMRQKQLEDAARDLGIDWPPMGHSDC